VAPDLSAVADVSHWEIDNDETGGADEKLWLVEPETEKKWLYKPVTVKDGHRHGEDWAEKIASQLAAILTIPHATILMATRHGVEGSCSLNLRPPGFDMQPGYVMMLAHPVPGYKRGPAKGRPGHSLDYIRAVLEGVSAPPGFSGPDHFGAFDVFVSYLLLDALIANRDRHDENWSVLIPSAGDGESRLCGTYDQAGSLGYNMKDDERQDRLGGNRGGVLQWAERGTAHRFEYTPGQPIPTLVELAASGLRMVDDEVKTYWLTKLDGVSYDTMSELVSSAARLSDPARSFAGTLLDINKGRLLHECR
jgi:hypothetical protein